MHEGAFVPAVLPKVKQRGALAGHESIGRQLTTAL